MKITRIKYRSLGELCDSYRNIKATMQACEQCGMFGLRWTCPPFTSDLLSRFDPSARVMLILTKITKDNCKTWSRFEMQQEINKEKVLLDDMMLPIERQLKGLLLTFTGKCQFCGEVECSRITQKNDSGCRHPESARPSLEAIGFDVCKIADEIFNSPISWSDSVNGAGYLTLVGALIFDSAS